MKSMKIFIGSSTEQSKIMKRISALLHESGHIPLCWNEAINLGQGTLIDQLIRISHEVDGAIFIFAEDDPVEVRGKRKEQPRDNVIFEYGLFMGTLGAESVVFVRVGKAKIANNLQGVVYINLPKPDKKGEISEGNVPERIESWAKRLAPAYVKGLGFDLAKYLTNIIAGGVPVGRILSEVAPKLVKRNATYEIRALCSDKGEYSETYYGAQFVWVQAKPKRCIKRVFVRARGDDYGFSDGETQGIIMHLDNEQYGVTIRWIFADSPWLGGPYPNPLGFAIFGQSWIMHWGLESGAYHDSTQQGDYGVLELLKNRFKGLWEHSMSFDDSLRKIIRDHSEVRS
jgi:hypothetical protein